jgi:hypothetical protein
MARENWTAAQPELDQPWHHKANQHHFAFVLLVQIVNQPVEVARGLVVEGSAAFLKNGSLPISAGRAAPGPGNPWAYSLGDFTAFTVCAINPLCSTTIPWPHWTVGELHEAQARGSTQRL